jgi:hypothetical protein
MNAIVELETEPPKTTDKQVHYINEDETAGLCGIPYKHGDKIHGENSPVEVDCITCLLLDQIERGRQ